MARWSESRWFDAAWLLFWIIASSVSCVAAAARLGATFDEPTYIAYGLESWNTGSSKRLLDLGTMPLPPHLQTLPLHLWERGRGESFEPFADLDRLLPVAQAWHAAVLVAAAPLRPVGGSPNGRSMGRETSGRIPGLRAELARACEPGHHGCRRVGLLARVAVPLSAWEGTAHGGDEF